MANKKKSTNKVTENINRTKTIYYISIANIVISAIILVIVLKKLKL